MHPSLYEGPRMVKPPIVQIAGMLRARRAGVTTDAWTWISDDAGQRVFDPPNVAGWDEQRWLDTARLSGRWSAAALMTERWQADTEDYDAEETANAAVTKALKFWGRPTLSSKTTKELHGFAARVEAAAGADWQQETVPGVAAERVADADRLEPRLPDLMSPAPHRKGCCNEFTRAELARRSLAEAGKGLPSIERGMPAPAGTGLSRRSFLLRTGGLALSVYGASLLSPRAFVDGIAEAASSQGKVLVSVFLEGGIDALSVLSPVNDDDYRRLRPTLKLPPGAGPTWSEDNRLQWHPSAAPLHQLHGEGKVTVFPGIGYANADQSHFTSRHYWEVGELDPGANTGWLGRLLDAVGSDDNPLQGLSLDGSLAPSLATARVPVAATWGASYDLWAPGVWGDVEELMFESFARLGAAAEKSRDEQLQGAGRVVRQASTLRGQLAAFSDEIESPVPYPDGEHFSESLAGLAAMLCGRLADQGGVGRCAGQLRHPRRAGGGLRNRPGGDLRWLARLPAGPRGTGARRSCPDPRLVRVRPPARGERRRVRGRDRSRRRRQRVSDR